MLDTAATHVENLRSTLSERLKKSGENRFLHRLHCVMMVLQGRSASEVARIYQDSPYSVARWTRNYKQFGLKGLEENPKPGRPARIGVEQWQALMNDLNDSPIAKGYQDSSHWNGKILSDYIEKQYAAKLSVRQCQRLLNKLNGVTIETQAP